MFRALGNKILKLWKQNVCDMPLMTREIYIVFLKMMNRIRPKIYGKK